MMTKERMLLWVGRWEDEARRAAELRDRADWRRCCTQIWTLEFALGFEYDDKPHPQDRIPFPEEPRKWTASVKNS